MMNEDRVRTIARAEVAAALGRQHLNPDRANRCDNCRKPVHLRLDHEGLFWSHDGAPPCTRDKGYSGPRATVNTRQVEYTPAEIAAALARLAAPAAEFQTALQKLFDNVQSRVRGCDSYARGWRDAVDALRLTTEGRA